MTRTLWPFDEADSSPFRELLDSAQASLIQEDIEDRFSLILYRLHYRMGRAICFKHAHRRLPLCGVGGSQFLARFAPKELERVRIPEFGRGILVIVVYAGHPKGAVTREEEMSILDSLGLDLATARRELAEFRRKTE